MNIPIDRFNHAIDAIRYACLGRLFDPKNICTVGEYLVSFTVENSIMCLGNTNYQIGQQVVISSTTLPGPLNVCVMPLSG